MAPQPLLLMEEIVLLKQHIIIPKVVLLHILRHLTLRHLVKLLHHRKWDISYDLLQLFGHSLEILVNVPTINGFL